MQQLTSFRKICHDSLEHACCPMCGVGETKKNKQFNFDPFCVVQCSNCQLWYLSPRLYEYDMLKIYGDSTYYSGRGKFGYSNKHGSYYDQKYSLKLTFRKFLHKLKKRGMVGGHLLEVGCGHGFLLEEAKPMFETLTGTDFDSRAIERIKQLGYQGIHGGIDAVPLSQFYDLILAIGVIEHIYKPIQFIKKLSQNLNSNGWLVIATPSMNSFWLKSQGKNWPSFKIPEHVAYYDKNTLTELFRRCGATKTTFFTYTHAFPLNMIINKVGFLVPKVLEKYNVWFPGVMFAIGARFDNKDSK